MIIKISDKNYAISYKIISHESNESVQKVQMLIKKKAQKLIKKFIQTPYVYIHNYIHLITNFTFSIAMENTKGYNKLKQDERATKNATNTLFNTLQYSASEIHANLT